MLLRLRFVSSLGFFVLVACASEGGPEPSALDAGFALDGSVAQPAGDAATITDGGVLTFDAFASGLDATLTSAADAAAEASLEDAGLDSALDATIEVPDLDFSEFDTQLEAYLADNGLQGASASIVHRDYGTVHVQGYGEFDADRVYLLASTSKILSVGIAMRAADQGLLDMDAPIGDQLPDWEGNKAELTLAQMFSMSSGLVALTENPLYGPHLCQFLGSSLTDCAQEIYAANDAVDRVPPDTEFKYGGGAWQLAGGVVEALTGKSWASLLEETYGAPCGTASLGYTNPFAQAFVLGAGIGVAAYPSTFQGNVDNLAVTDNPSIEGGGYIAAQDYAKILLMHLRDGQCENARSLSADAVQRMREDRIGEVYGGSTASDTLAGYGMGWWVSRDQPGLVVDPGLYGAASWLDDTRGYAAFVAIEGNGSLSGVTLAMAVKGSLEALFTP